MIQVTENSDIDVTFLQERREKWDFFVKSLTYIVGGLFVLLLLLAFFLL